MDRGNLPMELFMQLKLDSLEISFMIRPVVLTANLVVIAW